MGVLSPAFTKTSVSLNRSFQQIEGLLERHGVREQRYTHLRPEDPEAAEGEAAAGRVIYEFVWPGGENRDRRGVQIVVGYQPTVYRIGRGDIKRTVKGTTDQMAARALYWLLKAKFDSIEFGIEEFDVAFMPHLVTSLGTTFAQEPELIGQAMDRPESLAQLALPAPQEVA